jgi:two-component system sensor histidine kinase CpxA
MAAQLNIFLRIIIRFFLQATLLGGAFTTCDTLSAPAFAALNDAEHRPLRIRIAIEACEGKKEGDPCSFRAPRGIVDGLCLAGIENVFACRPHRGVRPPEAVAPHLPRQLAEIVKTPPAEQTTNPKNASQPETGVPPGTASEPLRQAETLSGQQPGKQDNTPTKESSASRTQTDPAPLEERSPHELPHPPRISDQLVQYFGNFGSYLFVALCAAGLTWYGLFRYSTVPLRRLRTVTQQLAGGDLSARVGEGLIHRKTEVADLGRDVDRMAERIESLVGAHQRLIRDVSHELRSPLARLNVALELARQSAGPTHSAPFDRIERESDRLNELIGQLLMLTKLESESGTIQRADFDITALIDEIAQDVDFEAKGNDRRVETALSEQVTLNGNKELLRQAVENLVRNAARYTDAGTAVEISLRKRESGGRKWAHIEVRDQGPGVPESKLFDIFRPFYRVNDARERQSGGTGVGLAISDRAVRLHGGSLRAFNAPGGGLIMEMELPLA